MFALVIRNSAFTARIRHNLIKAGLNNHFYVRRWYSVNDPSKVERMLSMLKEDLERQQEEDLKKKKELKAIAKKIPLKQKIINECKHYYHGFRLLVLETRLSAKYVFRLARGEILTRRERQQLVRTVSDLLRIVPFSFFIIVPFMELALPFFIKFFPNMLPSTFQDASKEDEKIRKQLKLKVEMAKFLQDTLEEIGLERRKKSATDSEQSKAYEFATFIRRARTEGSYVSNEEIYKFAKLFEDELALDNMAISQLRALCRMLSIQSIGTPEILRFQLMLKLRELKADDKLIMAEGGVDNLSTKDLQGACRARGMRALGVSEPRLRDQLKQWLELSLSDKVPPSLLLLSRALYLPEEFSFAQRIRTIITQLPEELSEETKQKLTELEGGAVDHKERLELIRRIEDGLKKERQRAKEVAKEKKKEAERKEAEKTELKEEPEKLVDEATHPMEQTVAQPDAAAVLQPISPAIAEAAAVAAAVAAKTPADADAKLDQNTLDKLEDVLHGSHVQEARHDISELKEKVIEHTEDLIEVNSLADEYSESKVARRLRARVNSLISGVDSLVARLEAERRYIDEEIRDPATPTTENKSERLVKIKDLLESLNRLQKATDAAKSARIEEALNALDNDTDGQIDANLALGVIEMLGKHTDIEISPQQMSQIVDLLKKEEAVEVLHRNEELSKTTLANGRNGSVAKLLADSDNPLDAEFPVRSKSGATTDESETLKVENGEPETAAPKPASPPPPPVPSATPVNGAHRPPPPQNR